jgi:hypothetical protein
MREWIKYLREWIKKPEGMDKNLREWISLAVFFSPP